MYSSLYLLDRCILPLTGLAATQNGQLEKLKDDKIAEQEKIIELQSKLIEKKDEEPDFVKDTVPSKLKNYSSVLQGGDYGQSSQSTVGEIGPETSYNKL